MVERFRLKVYLIALLSICHICQGEVNQYNVYPYESRKKKRAVIMMVTVVALFAVCWAPFHVVHMMIEYSECLPFSFDGSCSSFPARMDNESLKFVAIHLGNQMFSRFLSCFQCHQIIIGR